MEELKTDSNDPISVENKKALLENDTLIPIFFVGDVLKAGADGKSKKVLIPIFFIILSTDLGRHHYLEERAAGYRVWRGKNSRCHRRDLPGAIGGEHVGKTSRHDRIIKSAKDNAEES